jgi:hypothetical protein
MRGGHRPEGTGALWNKADAESTSPPKAAPKARKRAHCSRRSGSSISRSAVPKDR